MKPGPEHERGDNMLALLRLLGGESYAIYMGEAASVLILTSDGASAFPPKGGGCCCSGGLTASRKRPVTYFSRMKGAMVLQLSRCSRERITSPRHGPVSEDSRVGQGRVCVARQGRFVDGIRAGVAEGLHGRNLLVRPV